MVQVQFFSDRQGHEISCRTCRCPLVLTYFIGRTGRASQGVICGNYCDRTCPLCGGECEFNEGSDGNKKAGRRRIIECDDCGWVGNTPNVKFSGLVKRRRLYLEKIARDAVEKELAELVRQGRRCPNHVHISSEVRRFTAIVDGGRFWTTMRVRVCPICGDIGEPSDDGDWEPIPGKFLPPLDQCSSCGLPIRGDGHCGCS